MTHPFVAVLMGSDSDLPIVQSTFDILQGLDIPFEARITSAHRTPHETQDYVRDAEARGCAVFIAAAGLAAHLAGAVASQTCRPVIGIPLNAGPMQGTDALLSTVQMPGGIPVACVAIGKPGARNAGWLAAQILALQDPNLADRLAKRRDADRKEVIAKNDRLQRDLNGTPEA